jgi:hypothetical protein
MALYAKRLYPLAGPVLKLGQSDITEVHDQMQKAGNCLMTQEQAEKMFECAQKFRPNEQIQTTLEFDQFRQMLCQLGEAGAEVESGETRPIDQSLYMRRGFITDSSVDFYVKERAKSVGRTNMEKCQIDVPFVVTGLRLGIFLTPGAANVDAAELAGVNGRYYTVINRDPNTVPAGNASKDIVQLSTLQLLPQIENAELEINIGQTIMAEFPVSNFLNINRVDQLVNYFKLNAPIVIPPNTPVKPQLKLTAAAAIPGVVELQFIGFTLVTSQNALK